MIIIGLPVFLIGGGLFILTGMDFIYLYYALNLLVVIFTIYMDGIKGGTPGKLILKLRIVNKQGSYIGIPGAILRYIGKLVSGIILSIGFFMIGWTAKKQGLHDKIAGTYVVRQ
ncbi:MAG TPA: RDD family protein [Candidatus Nanoarchaeia archaeon]|nr:RDD family protein [Candidatus Nanoarchaeia archaeon]